MPQGLFPIKYESEPTQTGMTALAGLPVYLELLHAMRFPEAIDKHLSVRSNGQGWTDRDILLSLMMLNLAGGDCVDDMRLLEADQGFCKALEQTRYYALSRKERRTLEQRWRKKRQASFPSASSLFRYLNAFHQDDWDTKQVYGKAWIPDDPGRLLGFPKLNATILAFAQQNKPQSEATLDMDATLIETNKSQALCCYKHFKAYQPMNVWWAEHEMMVHTEFRAGNVPAGFNQLRILEESLALLPEGIKSVRLRSDTAGYQGDLLRYCAQGLNERFGRIEFVVGCPVDNTLKQAVARVPESAWKPLERIVDGRKQVTGKEWAEVWHVTDIVGTQKESELFRYIVTREPLKEQAMLPGMEKEQEYPFPTQSMASGKYKVRAFVTNMAREGGELIRWAYKRCGKSEHAHSTLKEDLAGGKLPSGRFGANAAWWWVSVLAFNLNAVMKRYVLEKGWEHKKMKAIRFHLIAIPGRVIHHARQLLIRLSKGHPSMELLLGIRRRLAEMEAAPS